MVGAYYGRIIITPGLKELNGYLHFQAPGPSPQFLFTGPDPQFVFNGPGPQFVFTDTGPKLVFTGPGPKLLFTGLGQSGAWACIYQPCSPKFVFTGPGQRFLLPCPEFAFTFLSIVVAVAAIILAMLVIS